MEGYIPPKLDQNCQCICHKQPGVMHVVACCRESEPQMTPTPTLQAAAMRTAAAQFCTDNEVGVSPNRGYVVGPFEQGEHSGTHPGMAYTPAILALPLEADHKALLREALRLPEIAALIAEAWCKGRDAAASAAHTARPLSWLHMEVL